MIAGLYAFCSAGFCPEKTENGVVKSNRTYAASGSTVTITVTPDKGYVLLVRVPLYCSRCKKSST